MKITKMTPGNYRDVYELWLSCKGMGLNNLDDSEQGINAFLERNPDTCFTAHEGDKLVGVILAGTDGRRGYIYHTAVNPQYRKRGIATALVDAVMDAMKNIGINKVALVVFRHNESGNEFWEKLGFTERHDLVYRNKAINEMIRNDT